MKHLNRIAIAVAAAALSLPALAADPAPEQCTVCGDLTWPAMVNPAPAIVLAGPAQAAPDTTQAEVSGPAPALAVAGFSKVLVADTTQPEVIGPAPAIRAAAIPASKPAHFAAK